MINSILKYTKIIVKSNISAVLLLGTAGICTFFPVLSGGFMGDDSGQIVTNIYIRSLKNIPFFLHGGTFYSGGIENKLLSEYYRPIMIIWYTIIYAFAGLQPFYYHLMQLLLHTINSAILCILFTRLIRSKKISYLLAFIFLVHPINTETIAYLGNIQDILFFFFGSIGLLLLTKEKISITWIFLIQLLFLLALLSKEIGLVYFLIAYSYIELFNLKKVRLIFILSSIISIGIYMYLRCGIASICTLGGTNSVVPIAHMPFPERLLQIPAIILFYIKTLFFPKTLAMFQYWIAPYNNSGFFLPLIIDLLFFFLILSVPFVMYIYRKKLPRFTSEKWFHKQAYTAKVYALFLIWFLIGITAHLNIMPLDATVAERWFYFTFVGILGITGVLFSLIRNKNTVYLVLLIVICLLAIRAHVRAKDWSDPYRLYSLDIKVSKGSASLENNFGAILFERGNIKEAEIHFRKAIKLAPHSPIYWSNLAEIYEKKGNYLQAEKYYLKSIENGRFYEAFERYVNVLLIQGKKETAKKFLKYKAIKTFPFNQNLQTLYHKL